MSKTRALKQSGVSVGLSSREYCLVYNWYRKYSAQASQCNFVRPKLLTNIRHCFAKASTPVCDNKKTITKSVTQNGSSSHNAASI